MGAEKRRFRLLLAIIGLQALFFLGSSFLAYALSVSSQRFLENLSLKRLDDLVVVELFENMKRHEYQIDQMATLLHDPSYNKTVEAKKGKLYVARTRLPSKKSLIEEFKKAGFNSLEWWREGEVHKTIYSDQLLPEGTVAKHSRSFGQTFTWFNRVKNILYTGVSATIQGKKLPNFVTAIKAINIDQFTAKYASVSSELAFASFDIKVNKWRLLQNTFTEDNQSYFKLYLSGFKGDNTRKSFETNLGNKTFKGVRHPIGKTDKSKK